MKIQAFASQLSARFVFIFSQTRPSSDSEAATMYKLAFYNLHLTYCTLDGASYILHKFLKFMFQKSLKNLLKKSLKHKMKNLSKL